MIFIFTEVEKSTSRDELDVPLIMTVIEENYNDE